MKMNNLLFYINKHKKIVYLSLLVLVLGLIFHKPIIEGLTSNMIGEYDYLKPVNEIVSDDTWKRLTTVEFQCSYNKDKCSDDFFISTIPRIKSTYNTAVTTDEINYFIQNGYWPWGSYITNAMKALSPPPSDSDLDQLKKSYSTRMLYTTYAINQSEKAMNPQPLSYKIYMGFTPPPTAETETMGTTGTTGTTTGATTGTTTTGTNNYYNKLVSAVGTIRGTGTTTGTNKYYNEFVSLCKKVNPVSS